MNKPYDKAIYDHFILEEGYRETSYLDHLGNYTIGIGHLLGRSEAFKGMKWTNTKVMGVFDADLDNAIVHARQIFPEWDILPPNVQLAIVDMIFNLGPYGFRKFKTTIRMIHNGKYLEAAAAALESKWAREDVPARARRTAKKLSNT